MEVKTTILLVIIITVVAILLMTVIFGKCELNVRASECSQAVPGLVLATPSSRLACKMEKRCLPWGVPSLTIQAACLLLNSLSLRY